MKIAYFTDMFLPHLNGVTTSLINQVTGLSDRGHSITIFAPKQKNKKPVKLSINNVHVEYMNSFPVFFYPEVRFASPLSVYVLAKVKKIDPDIIHFQSPSSAGMAGIMAAKILKKPVIGTFHGYFMEPEYLQVLGFKNAFQKITTSILWKYTSVYFNQCDGVTSPSEVSKKDLIKNGITKNIHIIHNSLNPSHVKRISKAHIQNLKDTLGLKKNVVLYVGRISIEKNIDQLMRSFQIVLKDQPDSSLCIIGKGPALKDLKKLVGTLKLKKHVVFLGEIQQEPLLTHGYYQIADMFATASLSELQPVSIIEAFAFGLPVVGSAKRGTEEMIKNVGLLSQPNDIKGFAKNILSILENPHLKAELQKKSLLAYKTKYDLETTTKQYEAYYQKFIKG